LLVAFVFAQGAVLQAQEQKEPVAAPTGKVSLQDRFNTASEAWEKNDCATAVPIFTALAGDPHFKPGSLPGSVVGLRRGLCLIRTGHQDEGEAMISAALPVVRAKGQGFDVDIAMAEYQLGVQAMYRWDHDTALAHLRASLALEHGTGRLDALARIAQLTAFDGGREGLDAVDEALRLAQPAGATPSKTALAEWHTLHARILLNQGDVKGGRAELKAALALSGGEKDHVTLAEALLRADVAQAAMLDHDKDEAYKFMALSGAGRIDKSPFVRARMMEPPSCGPDTGLTMEDSAVVEFSIGDDGMVSSAQPIYASGNYAKATAFARAVSNWAWSPQDAANIPAFFRAASRIELRCTNADGNGSGGASPLAPLRHRFDQWAQGVAVSYLPAQTLADDKPLTWQMLVTAAQAAQDRKDDAAELALRTLLAPRDLRPAATVRASIDRARALTQESPQAPEVRNAALVLLADVVPEQRDRRRDDGTAAAAQLMLADDPTLAQDALAQDTALLLSVTRRARGADNPKTAETLQRVAGDARLGDHHPLRQFAQLRLANDAARKGDLAQAQTLFAATGLSAEQCALIGPKPAMSSNGAGATAFPMDALRWGFEGWVRTEFDIQADGHTAGARAVVSYPPFIFANAAQRILNGARYQSSFRPNGGAACSANNEMVKFTIPSNMNTVSVTTKKKV
jgi:outer membrane biosynthesis protein TonB